MEPAAGPDADEPAGSGPVDAATLRAVGEQLADAVERALPGWVERSVRTILVAYEGTPRPEVLAAAREAGARAAADVGPVLRSLVTADVDEQRTNPLSILRGAVRYPTEVLRAAGVPGVVRDEHDERHFPDDDYGLTPMAFADVDPSLHELGMTWGAAKAQLHIRRHRGAARGAGG